MLNKKELVWREILTQAIEHKKFRFTQKGLAEQFGISLSTVFNALKIPRASGAIEVRGKFFAVRDVEKLLNIWATFRNLKKDILYETRVEISAAEVEGAMPPTAVFAAFSAYRLKFGGAPADYDRVYVYAPATALPEFKKRFPPATGFPNLTVLTADRLLPSLGTTVPTAQLYVDLWNLPEWYARDFLNALRQKIIQ